MERYSLDHSVRKGASRRRRRSNSKATEDDQIPEVYRQMLEEAEARDPGQFNADRPIKRRRVSHSDDPHLASSPLKSASGGPEKDAGRKIQTVYDSADSDESDVEWEDVDISHPTPGPSNVMLETALPENLEITLHAPELRKKTVQKRQPVTAAERRIRLDIHKAHLLCLLGHIHIRNRWCNDEEVQEFLKQILPKQIKTLLHPDESKPQFIRSTTFVDGLNQAGERFNQIFTVTKPGLKRAHWAETPSQLKKKLESIMSGAEVFLSKEDFRSQAKTMQGSQDFGAQLFCALLRSVAVEARLVCSLQVLPFSGTFQDTTPSKKSPEYTVISSDSHETSTDERKGSGSPSLPRSRRLGRPEFKPRPAQSKMRKDPGPFIRESSYPIFWVEAFNEAMQRWVSIDPMVTKTIGKPNKLEPPASDLFNIMNYVVGFDGDSTAKDITQRYAKAFNAKTRKLRVESTPGGERWWKNALEHYAKPLPEDRDALETSELTAQTAREPIPRNIQDFKDHPIYALERHLRHREVIFPKRVIGHVGLSKTTPNSHKSDPIYRRTDVHTVRSAGKWYMLGKNVKTGEQPLKHIVAKRPKSAIAFDSDDEATAAQDTALYAEFQTETYRPPPVVDGRLTKNPFGNVDVYVPSMVPPGAVHIKEPDAARAARILGVDYADAVTRFDFKGRQGTAVTKGIVIAIEYQEALEEVLRGLADDRQQAAFEARSAEAIRLWRLFLVKLRIAERVKEYAGEDERADSQLASDTGMGEDEAGGGFFLEPHQFKLSPPSSFNRNNKYESTMVTNDHEDEAPGGGFVPDEDALEDGQAGLADLSAQDNDDREGGFISDEARQDDRAAISLSTTNAPSSPESARKTRPSKASRYELIVVPKKPVPEPVGSVMQSSKSRDLEGTSAQDPISVDSSTNADSKSVSLELVSRPPSAGPQVPNSPAPEDSDSVISKGSRMTEDPDDEDAIPLWLMSDEE
ncbi:hypothetical protein N7532_008619 [Penicillium argentinense]|uniref:DNA repair protein rhp41 n=1 Tax=Penicillium argentinense TaxID=1131581 RepID=A0A9W9EY07_9EURO|nr:uncharacterized protein N7532_008619 [Penicillium argentinense]KAJ5089935.1 hypothetical protein N7532_008619 [Penicillium argentinense]